MTTNQRNALLNIETRPVRQQQMSDDEALGLLEELRIVYMYEREGRALAKAIESIKKTQQYEILYHIGTD